MKILLINTDDTMGGAAIACTRLYEALEKENISVKMLVQAGGVPQNKSNNSKIESFAKTWFQKKKAFLRFSLERLYFVFFEKSKEVRFAFSPAIMGVDISEHPLVKEADIIHLHWINFGFLSLNSLEKLIKTGKPIVWTLHDMWAFTGGCHHSGTCENYQNACGNCERYLKNSAENDLSNKIWHKKNTIFVGANPCVRPNADNEIKDKNIGKLGEHVGSPLRLSIVTCSKWLENRAKKSSLFREKNIQAIPNPLNIELFSPRNKTLSKQNLGLPIDKKLILFAAAKVSVIWKGFSYFIESLEKLKPQLIDNQAIELLILGQAEEELVNKLPFKTHSLGRINDINKIIEIYNAADIFVIPSLEENLPNTIMEAMACGTPAVGFETGGIPEMIEHQKNGFLAKYKSAEELATGIYWTLFESNYEELSKNARQKVVENYSEKVVAQKYIDLYRNILKND